MPKSRTRKDRKQNLNKYKTKRKQMNNPNEQLASQFPPVRNYPIWSPDAKITVTGYEWEAINNGLAQLQYAATATQAVMSRHLLDGTITMEFEKLNPKTLQYEPMPAEEKAKYTADYQASIANFKAEQEKKAAELAEAQKNLPSATENKPQLVDQTGAALTASSEPTPEVIEKPKRQAKVVKMGTKAKATE